jgi:hypothetical protein
MDLKALSSILDKTQSCIGAVSWFCNAKTLIANADLGWGDEWTTEVRRINPGKSKGRQQLLSVFRAIKAPVA